MGDTYFQIISFGRAFFCGGPSRTNAGSDVDLRAERVEPGGGPMLARGHT